MRIIVGLGNPDLKYLNTFHNMGFMAIDTFSERYNAKFSFNKKFNADCAEINVRGQKVLLVKPRTYMNLSGQAVLSVTDYYKVDLKDLLVVYDDLDLDVGSIRIRSNGSAGTHNGMRNIVSLLSSTGFPRVRIGIKPPEELKAVAIIDYVLMSVPKFLHPVYKDVFKSVADALELFANGGSVDEMMRLYNGKLIK